MQLEPVGAMVLNLGAYLDEGQQRLGPVRVRDDIKSGMGPFRELFEYRATYPPSVVKALLELYAEYNEHFAPLVEANREWATDYQYCRNLDGSLVNRWVQIDMVGLPDKFLAVASKYSVAEVKKVLRHSVFEFENSLAMYQLLERITPAGRFRKIFRRSLDELRILHGRPIALLAVTEVKYRMLLSDELGVESQVSDETVRELTGFDTILGPEQFREHLEQNSGECKYLLYVRSSDPLSKLRKPSFEVQHPLLGDPTMRRVIKACSLTFNVDDPSDSASAKRINDTKAYMSPMGIAHVMRSEQDIFTLECIAHLGSGKPVADFAGQRLSVSFAAYLQSCGVMPEQVASGERRLRAKPLQGTYGCYGHHTLSITESKRRAALRADMKQRGSYVLQPELTTPVVHDPESGVTYGFIDRNFVTVDTAGHLSFMGGFRSLLPVRSAEAQKGRFHGNEETIWAPVVPAE